MPKLEDLTKELEVVEQAMLVWPERTDYISHHRKLKRTIKRKQDMNRVFASSKMYRAEMDMRDQYRHLMDKDD